MLLSGVPRACFTFPLWRALIKEQVKIIYVIRPPIEIAKSLQKRNKFPPEKSLRLCIKYKNAASFHVSKEEHIIVKYHDFFNARLWHAVQRLAEFAELWEWRSGYEKIAEFISPDLWHHREGK